MLHARYPFRHCGAEGVSDPGDRDAVRRQYDANAFDRPEHAQKSLPEKTIATHWITGSLPVRTGYIGLKRF